MLLNQSQYAKHCTERGMPCTQQGISKAVKHGKIPVTADGKIDAVVADAVWLVNRVGPVAVERRAADPPPLPPPVVQSPADEQHPALAFLPPEAGTTASEQAQLARARREKIQLEMAAKRGELQPIGDFEEAWSANVIATRNRFLMIPDQIPDPGVRALVDRLIREALMDLSQMQLGDLHIQVRDQEAAA